MTGKRLYGRPVILNTMDSDAGISFAARHSDIFTTSPTGSEVEIALTSLPDHTGRIKAEARWQ